MTDIEMPVIAKLLSVSPACHEANSAPYVTAVSNTMHVVRIKDRERLLRPRSHFAGQLSA